MMPSAPAVCFFLLSCFLTSGYARIIGSQPPPLKTSNLSTTKNMCSDCAKIIELFSDMLSQPGTELQISPQCTFCLFFIRKVEDLLPKERTEESVVKLMERICDYLPEHYKEKCDDMVEKYGKQIIDFLLSSATPHTICTLLHMCFGQDTPVIVPSACKTCKNLMILTQTHLGQNASETQMTSVLWKTCQRHPNTLPGCEPFIQSHFTALVNILSKRDEAVNACQKFFCVGHE